ncbi:capsular polysaccharide export protein, LipB/KpsS family, partial [Treponema sp. R6D11]
VYGNFEIGFAIASSLAIEIDKSSINEWREQIDLYYLYGVLIFNIIKTIISDYSINKGYVYNGRFCFSRAFIQAFSEKGITFYTHERGSTIYKYELYKNTLPHDINNFTQRVNNWWNKENNLFFKKNVADVFFKKRYLGQQTDFLSFTAEQKHDNLPKEIIKYKKILSIFTSSTFEYDYLGKEYTYKSYSSQIDGINQIINSLKDDKDIGIFLREHPNQKTIINNFRRNLKNIKADNFYLIPSESDISSYGLLLNSDVVITFNSTMGIEATYWGIPSILCSNAVYENFSITYEPSSHEEVIKLIKSNLKPIVGDDVYKYGYYQATYGID